MLLAMASSKEKLVNVRLTPAVHEQFKIACELKGASMSSLMHQFIVRTIREEKDREPQAFILTPIHSTLQVDPASLEVKNIPLSPPIGEKVRQRKKA